MTPARRKPVLVSSTGAPQPCAPDAARRPGHRPMLRVLTPQRVWYAATAVLLVTYFAAGVFGRFPWKADEPYYLGVMWQMLQSGDWSIPRLAGQPFMEKPPLTYWLGAIFIRLPGLARSRECAHRGAGACFTVGRRRVRLRAHSRTRASAPPSGTGRTSRARPISSPKGIRHGRNSSDPGLPRIFRAMGMAVAIAPARHGAGGDAVFLEHRRQWPRDSSPVRTNVTAA